jgi:hypothetical protein
MKNKKDWQALKKKHSIPSGAVKKISFGDHRQLHCLLLCCDWILRQRCNVTSPSGP